MTDVRVILIPIEEILVEARQREDLGDIDSLAASIAKYGLLHPIVVEEFPSDDNYTYRLIAGQRRLEAHILLGYDRIDALPFHELSEVERRALELEENIRRKDLTWEEYVRAVVDYHNLQITEAGTSWTQENSAKSLGIPIAQVSAAIQVVAELSGPQAEFIRSQPTLTAAYNAVRKHRGRRIDTALSDLIYGEVEAQIQDTDDTAITTDDIDDATNIKPSPAADQLTRITSARPPTRMTVLNEDFFAWVETFSGRPFNFIHMDPPYGLSGHTRPTTSTFGSRFDYEDSLEIYMKFITTIFSTSKLWMGNAHAIVWFPMIHYCRTVNTIARALHDRQQPYMIDPYPLVWHKSDGAAMPIGRDRRPRRVYETALFIALGEAKVVSQYMNGCYLPTASNRLHVSEKPVPVLEAFMRLVVDETTEMLDPCCGSGTSLIAAHSLGAARGIGIEIAAEMATHAKRRL